MKICCCILLASLAMLCVVPPLSAQGLPEMNLSLIDKWRPMTAGSMPDDEASLNGRGGPRDGSLAPRAPADSLVAMNRLALEEFRRGNRKAADTILRTVRQVLYRRPGGKKGRDMGIVLTNMGLCKYGRGDFGDAESRLREAYELRERISGGAPDPDLAESLANLGALYYDIERRRPGREPGALDSAASMLGRAMAMYGRLDTAAHRARFAECLANMGILSEFTSDHVGAVGHFRRALGLLRGFASQELLLSQTLDLFASIMIYHGDRMVAGALLAEAVAARQRYYHGADRPEMAWVLGDLASFRADLGNMVVADSLYASAVAMARRLAGGGDDSLLARLVGEQGELRLRDGDVMGALRLLREAVDRYRRLCVWDGDLGVELARNLVRLGSALIREGDYISSEAPLREAWEYYKKAGYLRTNRSEHALSLQGLGLVFNYAGEYHHAGVDFYHSISMFRDLFNRNNDPGLAPCLAEIGNVYRERGWYVRAESLLVASVETYRCLGDGRPDAGAARALGYLGRYYQDKGDSAHAAAYFDSSIAIRRLLYHGNNPHDLVEGLREVASFRAERGDTAGAEGLLVEAMTLLDGPGRGSDMDRALTESMLGRFYLMSGDHSRARAYVEDAYAIYLRVSNGHEHPALAHGIRDMAILRAYQGDARSADSLFVVATDMYTRLFYTGFQLDPVEGLDVIGRFAERWGDSVRARRAFDSLLNILPKITRQMSLTDGEEGQINLQKRLAIVSYSMVSYFLRQRSAEDLFNASLWLKGRILSALEWRNTVLQELEGGDREIDDIRRQYVQARRFLSSTRSALDSAEFDLWIRARAETLAISNRLEDRLARVSATLARSRQRTTWKTIRDHLGGHVRVVEYMRIPYIDQWGRADSTYYCAVVVGPGRQPPALIRLCEERALERILSNGVGDPRAEQRSYINDGASRIRLYRLVWSPIDSVLGEVDSVYISPDGLLNRVAFAPLTDESNRMIVERYELRYLFSARDLVARGPVPSDAHPAPPSAAVFGGVSYDADAATLRRSVDALGPAPRSALSALEAFPFPLSLDREASVNAPLPPLEGTMGEAESIAKILSRHGYEVALYTGAKATEEAFDRLVSPTVLHVATHGYSFAPPGPAGDDLAGLRAMGGVSMLEYADDPLLRSGLLLAGANRAWTRQPPVDKVADGIVSAFDVAHMDLGRTSLVVLSACETGLGDLRAGEGVFGMKRAFKAAGAATVVMSLWKVPDSETQRLMARFYTNWLDRGMSKADAFSAAQRELADRERSPYSWAGFVLVGE